MKIVCLSDTHNAHQNLRVPPGDVLIHAGDATVNGTIDEVAAFSRWFESRPHKVKIFVAGNHDWLFETDPARARKILGDQVIYLQDEMVEIENLKIYGSPWQPRFFDWAFNLERGREMREKWRSIPAGTDVLITHGPPFGILDETPAGDRAGCEELRKKVEEIRPRLHVFGHIHHGYGTAERFDARFVNAANCDEAYAPTNLPIVVEM